MKKNLLKFLPLMAALLLATSCSKDDENNAPTNGRDGVHTVSTSTIPFSIKVNTGNSLKKIGYAPDEQKPEQYNISFTEDDEKKGLQMVIKEGDIKLGVLTLQKDLETFSGEIFDPSTQDAKLTAEITVTPADAKTYSETFDDLLKNCSHTFRGSFKYNEDKNVDLYDQNAYLAISMSPCQCYLDVKSGDADAVECKLSAEGEVWVAVQSGVALTVGITKAAKDVTAGKIYTISRPHCVDLGIKYTDENDENYGKYTGILWTDHNIGATDPWDYGDYYAWGETTTKNEYKSDWSNYAHWKNGALTKYTTAVGNGKPDLETGEDGDDVANKKDKTQVMPSAQDFQDLKDNCYWEWTSAYKGKKTTASDNITYDAAGFIVYKAKSSSDAGKVAYGEKKKWQTDYTEHLDYDPSKDTHIFIPAAGFRSDASLLDPGECGYYWSSSLYAYNPSYAHELDFYSGNVVPQGNVDRYYVFSVRAVRRSN